MRRSVRLLGNAVRFALFILVGIAAGRFFLQAISVEGWSPRTFFGLLLITGGIGLTWRAFVDLRRSVRRYRS